MLRSRLLELFAVTTLFLHAGATSPTAKAKSELGKPVVHKTFMDNFAFKGPYKPASKLYDIGFSEWIPPKKLDGVLRPTLHYTLIMPSKDETLVLVPRIYGEGYPDSLSRADKLRGTVKFAYGYNKKSGFFEGSSKEEEAIFNVNDSIYYMNKGMSDNFTAKEMAEYDLMTYDPVTHGRITHSLLSVSKSGAPALSQ